MQSLSKEIVIFRKCQTSVFQSAYTIQTMNWIQKNRYDTALVIILIMCYNRNAWRPVLTDLWKHGTLCPTHTLQGSKEDRTLVAINNSRIILHYL